MVGEVMSGWGSAGERVERETDGEGRVALVDTLVAVLAAALGWHGRELSDDESSALS